MKKKYVLLIVLFLFGCSSSSIKKVEETRIILEDKLGFKMDAIIKDDKGLNSCAFILSNKPVEDDSDKNYSLLIMHFLGDENTRVTYYDSEYNISSYEIEKDSKPTYETKRFDKRLADVGLAYDDLMNFTKEVCKQIY